MSADLKEECSPRLELLDALRGLAVIWMLLFHFFYDLRNFNIIDWDFNSGFWYAFPRAIVFTFLFCVGLSLFYSHAGGFKKKAFIQRSLKLFLAAMAVSIGTYIVFPKVWVYFGTLHCIFVGSLLGVWFVNHRLLAFGLMVTIMIFQFLLGYDIDWVSSNVTRRYAIDFIPIYPWFWTILLGIILAPWLKNSSILAKIRCPQPLLWLGKHSLKIYLLHQPVIFGGIIALKELKLI